MSLKGTILLRISFGEPRFFKKDKELTAEVQDKNQMSKDSGNFNKRLIPASHLKRWKDVEKFLRKKFYELTTPWDDSGYRVCTPDAFWKFQRYWNEHHPLMIQHRDDFLSEYDDIVELQRNRLGDAFIRGEFPALDEVEKKFRADLDAMPIPEKGTLIHLGEEEEKRLIKRAEERLLEAHKENYKSLLSVTEHLAKTLSDEGKTKNCHSTTLTNVIDLAERIPDLNFQDDPMLNQMADHIKDLCANIEMKDLKQDEELRKKIAAGATETSQHIESMVALYA